MIVLLDALLQTITAVDAEPGSDDDPRNVAAPALLRQLRVPFPDSPGDIVPVSAGVLTIALTGCRGMV